MTQEDKKLLLIDLCARLPYGVKVQYNNEIFNIDWISALYEEVKLDIPDNYTVEISEVKPYLRPMSSMTKEEYELLANRCITSSVGFVHFEAGELIEWLTKNMFDYLELIPKGLAIEITEKNNPYK